MAKTKIFSVDTVRDEGYEVVADSIPLINLSKSDCFSAEVAVYDRGFKAVNRITREEIRTRHLGQLLDLATPMDAFDIYELGFNMAGEQISQLPLTYGMINQIVSPLVVALNEAVNASGPQDWAFVSDDDKDAPVDIRKSLANFKARGWTIKGS